MKLRTIVKIAIISSVVLLCTGFVMFSFFKLSAIENRTEFDLYTLVPPSASAVFETDNLAGLVQEIDELDCSRDDHFLYISQLFSYLKMHLYTMLDEKPHGLSKQMNKILLSFHYPDNDRNQVLYCSLGDGDYEVIESFIKEYCSNAFPSKMFDYKGEEIRIYPMVDDEFLACYITSNYLAVSYQKKLIEEVIDAHLSGRSILNDTSFSRAYIPEKNNVSATIYTRMEEVAMGKATDGIRVRTTLGGWTGFDLKMNGNAIYLSGINHDADTCVTFMNMLRKQQPIGGFSGDILPASTFFFNKRSVSDWQAMFDFTIKQEYATATYSDYIKSRDKELFDYLKENAGPDVVTCFFNRLDTLKLPAAVMSVSVADMIQAERLLKNLLGAAPREDDAPLVPNTSICYTSAQAYVLYRLPRNTLFAQLTGITDFELHAYACFYAGRLLLAPDVDSLVDYIRLLEKKEMYDTTDTYKGGVLGLSKMSNFMMIADLEEVFNQPENYARLVPSFFFRNPDFFRHFVLSAQFTSVDGEVYPNIVLMYKGE